MAASYWRVPVRADKSTNRSPDRWIKSNLAAQIWIPFRAEEIDARGVHARLRWNVAVGNGRAPWERHRAALAFPSMRRKRKRAKRLIRRAGVRRVRWRGG